MVNTRNHNEDCCELCARCGLELTIHHLTPKDEGGAKGERAMICRACHSQVHVLFSNKELARTYNTIAMIRSDERMGKFLRWIKKQDPAKKVRVRRKRIRGH